MIAVSSSAESRRSEHDGIDLGGGGELPRIVDMSEVQFGGDVAGLGVGAAHRHHVNPVIRRERTKGGEQGFPHPARHSDSSLVSSHLDRDATGTDGGAGTGHPPIDAPARVLAASGRSRLRISGAEESPSTTG
jgi:hypothetical protein